MLPLSVSLVVYRTDPSELQPLFRALAESNVCEWIVVDNAASENERQAEELRRVTSLHGGRYVAAPTNIGFGAGHNLAFASQSAPKPAFHLMVNPDISFQPETLARLVDGMRMRPDAGLLMPKVCYQDGTFQPICKLLPTPVDFAIRRFAPGFIKKIFRARLATYELQGIEDHECDRVPFLSGCFLFARRSVLDEIGGFDDRFFLYLEDVDLCRRMARHSKLVYWPGASVVHGCYRGAYRSRKLMVLFLRSATAYFMKWGWFFDCERRAANRAALDFIRTR